MRWTIAVIVSATVALPAIGAKYAGEFMALGVGARPLAMGGAGSAYVSDVTAAYWNPAGLSGLPNRQVAAMHAETFGSLLNHDYVGYAMPWRGGAHSAAAAVSLVRLGGGGVKITALDDPSEPIGGDNRPRVVREEGHADYVLYASYARSLRGNLSAGASVKAIYRDVVTTSAFGAGVDLGVRWAPSSIWSFGAVLRDATSTVLSYDTGTTESVLPMLTTGLAYSSESRFLSGRVTLAADSDVRFEGRDESAQVSLGGASADLRLGAEYSYRGVVAGRVGSDAGDLTAGVGLAIGRLSLDFAYLSHPELDATYRISASFGF